jgi:hypothetical protein
MKTIAQHIEHVRRQPHHVRKRVAFGTAGILTGIVALAWFAINLTIGTFAIKGSNFAQSTGQESPTVVAADSGNSANLAGAAAVVVDQSAPARIQIVDTTPTSTQKKAEETTIPF